MDILDSLVAAAAWLGLGGLGGAWINHVFSERGATRAAARRWNEAVTDQVEKLANNHYWTIANHAGALASKLESHLQSRELSLMLNVDPEDVSSQLEDLSRETASAVLPNYVRMRWYYHEFQFQSSSAYLLPDDWAGSTMRKLYNRFVIATEAIRSNDQLLRDCSLKRREHPDIDAAMLLAAILSEKEHRSLRDKLEEEIAAWLLEGGDTVRQAAHALRAASELLQHQLDLLYAGWFDRPKHWWNRRSDDVAERFQRDASFTAETQRVLQRTLFEGELLVMMRESEPRQVKPMREATTTTPEPPPATPSTELDTPNASGLGGAIEYARADDEGGTDT